MIAGGPLTRLGSMADTVMGIGARAVFLLASERGTGEVPAAYPPL